MKEKLKQIGDRLSSFVSSHKKAATITASALLVLAGVLVIALVLSGGTKKNAQSEDDKKMLKDETVKVDKDKKKGENETTSADGKKNDKKDDKKDANSETKDANGETKDNKQSQTDNKTNNTGNKKTNVANNNSAAGNGAQAANNGTAATGNVAGQSGNTQSTNHGAANQNTNAGAASQGGQTQGGQAQGGGNTSGGNQSIPVTPMSSGTDTNQGNEEQLYNDLFNLGNRVTISLDIPDSEIQKLQDDYVRYGNGKSPIYRRVTKMTVTINNTSYNIYDVGVKMKGNTSRCPVYNNGDVNSRNLIHLKLSFDEAFDNTSYYGNEAINWDANLRKQRKSRTFATLDGLELKWNRNFDGTYVANYYGNIMFRNFGVYAQNTSLANVRFGGYNYGVYTIYEPVGKKFLKRYMPGANTGDLYKCGWSNKGANYTTDSLNSVGVETPNRQLTYDLKTNKTTSNHSSLKNLINQINSNSSKQTFANVVDANNFVMFAAVSYFEGNPDDLRNNFNNHYVYFRNGKAIFFPYDYDRCFGITTSNKDMTQYSPYASETALQGNQRNPLYNNSIIGRTNNYTAEYTNALATVANSGWLNYANYKQYYDIAKANYESVAIPDANVNLYKKEFGENRGQFFDRQALAFSENNGYRMSVSDYMSRIYNRYVTAMNK